MYLTYPDPILSSCRTCRNDLLDIARLMCRVKVTQPRGMGKETKRCPVSIIVSKEVRFEEFHGLLRRVGIWQAHVKHGAGISRDARQRNHRNIPESWVRPCSTRFNCAVLKLSCKKLELISCAQVPDFFVSLVVSTWKSVSYSKVYGQRPGSTNFCVGRDVSYFKTP